jgi:integrase
VARRADGCAGHRDARFAEDGEDDGGEWSATWLDGYGTRRASTRRQARTHVAQIVAAFGPMRLGAVRPSHVKAWTAKLHDEGLAASYVYALHSRLAQIFADAVHDGIVPRSPCSRRTSPMRAKQRAYVATTEQVWAMHDAMPARLRAAVLLGAFAGLRIAEACGLRVSDVDFMRGVVTPAVQYPAQPLKTETSKTPVPIPRTLAVELAAHVARWRADTLLTGDDGGQLGPWALERAMRAARERVAGLPAGFRYQGPTALLRKPAYRVGRQRQGRASAAAARVGDDHARHVRASVPRLRRGDQDSSGCRPARSCGLSAD